MMKVWRVINTSPDRKSVSYTPNRWQKKTQKFWSETEAKKLYHKLVKVFGGDNVTLESAELSDWEEVSPE